MFCCLKFCINRYHNNNSNRSADFLHNVCDNKIHLDNSYMGHQVVIVKNSCRICGTGGALANAPLVQSKSYFEVKIQQCGEWSIGIATRKTDLNKSKGGSDKESWCLTSDDLVLHDGKELYKLTIEKQVDGIETSNLLSDTPLFNHNDGALSFPPQTDEHLVGKPTEGDTIGIAYDHVELNFYLNGKNLNMPVLNVKGSVYPALYVDNGAILDIILEDFIYGPPTGFDKIMIEHSLL